MTKNAAHITGNITPNIEKKFSARKKRVTSATQITAQNVRPIEKPTERKSENKPANIAAERWQKFGIN